MTSHNPDPAADDVVIRLDFAAGGGRVELLLQPPQGGQRFMGDPSLFDRSPPLPPEIEFQQVKIRAGKYKDLLRGFVVGPDKPEANNAFEVLSAQFARSGSHPFEWRICGTPPKPGARNPATLPWELVLYDTVDKGLIGRAAVVRSLKRTDAFAPTTLSTPFRTLVVQGGQLGRQALRFDKERANLERAWQDLGPELRQRIDEPAIGPVKRGELENAIRKSSPHLLWFSGHGEVDAAGFGFLFDGDDKFTPITDIIPAIRKACLTGPLPLIVAFWTCESARLASDGDDPDAEEDARAATPAQAAPERLPALVEAMMPIGIEVVIGCQTRVLDPCSRIMARALFRNLAEGQGPARALAAARGELARGSEAVPPGGEAEWPSPVLWIGGARMPVLRWARPPGEDEAILLNKLCYESIFRNDEAASVWQQDPAPAASGANWVARAPCWVVHKAIGYDAFDVFESLRSAQSEAQKALLVIPVTGADSDNFLRAFATTMLELRRRIFPGVALAETDWLMSVFALAEVESRREEAWRRLLDRDDLAIAIIDRGGLTDLAALNEAMARRFPIVVFSPSPIDRDTMQDRTGPAAFWNSDVFASDGRLPKLTGAARAFLEALATLNQPLTQDAINDFGNDFELAHTYDMATALLVGYGGRFVLRAALADALTRGLGDSRRRAAHLACLHFLERRGIDPARSAAAQLGWRLDHALALDRREDIVGLAAGVIAAWRAEGRNDEIVRVYQSLKQLRRKLPVERLLDVARAYVLAGRPNLALDVLVQVNPGVLAPLERIDFALQHAEALRNTNDLSNRKTAADLLENALREAEALQRQDKEDRELEYTVLVLRHDVARNDLYFRRKSADAKRVYQEVIAACGDEPARQYLKAAALRNLGDVCDRYAYGLAKDTEAAITHFEDAKEVARTAPEARVLLPEIAYELAKAFARGNRPDQSAGELLYALKTARRDGNAIILALAGNRRFWTEHAGDTTLDNATWPEWRAVERQLESVERHAWAARALVNSRVRAAKRRTGMHPEEAIAVLSEARALLRRHDGLQGPSDRAERWIPVYAGLAMLQAPQGNTQTAYNRLVWKELASDLPETADATARDPVEIWNAVP